MRLHLIAVGRRMPDWVEVGYEEFARRLPPECRLHLIEIPAPRRAKGSDTARLVRQEGDRMLAAIPPGARVIALDERGQAWRTQELAARLEDWMQGGRDVALLVGGADGLARDCLERAETRWSLSPLTLPHPLVRIVLAEQIYRAWSICKGHPYHRA